MATKSEGKRQSKDEPYAYSLRDISSGKHQKFEISVKTGKNAGKLARIITVRPELAYFAIEDEGAK